jgi:hypothetical protein
LHFLGELGLRPKRVQRELQPGRRLQPLSTLTASYDYLHNSLDAEAAPFEYESSRQMSKIYEFILCLSFWDFNTSTRLALDFRRLLLLTSLLTREPERQCQRWRRAHKRGSEVGGWRSQLP